MALLENPCNPPAQLNSRSDSAAHLTGVSKNIPSTNQTNLTDREISDTLLSSPPTVSRIVEKGPKVLDYNKDLGLDLSIVEI